MARNKKQWLVALNEDASTFKPQFVIFYQHSGLLVRIIMFFFMYSSSPILAFVYKNKL